MQTTEELFYTIALTQVNDIGSMVCKNLIAYCGSAKNVLASPKNKLKKIPLVGETRAQNIVEAARSKNIFKIAEKEIAFVEKHKIEVLSFTQSRYPRRMNNCDDSPVILYYKGNANLNHERVVSIVGTRKATEYGKDIVQKIIRDLSATDVLIVSGMAYGIDGIAHHAALENALPTVGVLAHGLNRIYPEKHKNLAKQMLENGGLLTEYSTQCNFHRGNFPERNRIVAGMCDAVIVVESDVKGGAVITANIANSYNRDVFAVPGKIGEKYSRGCNFLIKTFKANILESGKDLIQAMNWENVAEPKVRSAHQLQLALNETEKNVYELLSQNERTIDELLALGNISAGELSATLLEMEMNGLVKSFPGKRYKLAR